MSYQTPYRMLDKSQVQTLNSTPDEKRVYADFLAQLHDLLADYGSNEGHAILREFGLPVDEKSLRRELGKLRDRSIADHSYGNIYTALDLQSALLQGVSFVGRQLLVDAFLDKLITEYGAIT